MRKNEIIKSLDVVLETQFYADVMHCVRRKDTEVCGVGQVRVEDGGEKLVVHSCELLDMDLGHGGGHADVALVGYGGDVAGLRAGDIAA